MADNAEQDLQPFCGLCFRQEGPHWVARVCPAEDPNSEESVVLGSLHVSIVQSLPEAKQRFDAMMIDCFRELIESKTGKDIVLSDPIPAAQTAGHA